MPRLMMTPATGERRLRFVGDRLSFALAVEGGASLPAGWRALLRTNLGRAQILRQEIIQSHFRKLPLAGASWRDVPMRPEGGGWALDLPLTEVGFFRAKAYAVDAQGRQHWPEGPDVGITVHPDGHRTANTIYCAFVRLFGKTKTAVRTKSERHERQLNRIDHLGYTVIPPSGNLRDLVKELPHIFDTLGCRILHLLPINPTPTTQARFGRFGSPYACGDLTAIDPALVEFEKRTTGVDQFRELTYATHLKGGRLFLDLAINHTGWLSPLQENHPEWFARDADGNFVSPGAWGVTWGDLVELEHKHPELWDYLAGVFLEWCRRGVDGFRCDAGYKVPLPAWQFITARVQQEFPETIFLLEGLGGAWELTENLLTDGGMQWAYSELFQEFSGAQVAGYLVHARKQSQRVGVLVHYSETHDNPRLAAKGRAWSLLRNRLCALTSVCGGYGFTCGVEWLAPEKILVHQANGLAWGNPDNLVPELARLNRLLVEHPSFFDGAKLTQLSPVTSPVFALRRDSAEGSDTALVLVNTDPDKEQTVQLESEIWRALGEPAMDLLDQPFEKPPPPENGKITLTLGPAAALCLAATPKARGLSGQAYRTARAQAAWALTQLQQAVPMEAIGPYDWRELAAWVSAEPEHFLASLPHLNSDRVREDLLRALRAACERHPYPQVVTWELSDCSRILPVPPGHWLLLRDEHPFRATLAVTPGSPPQHARSVEVKQGHVACFAFPAAAGDAELNVERYAEEFRQVQARLRFLPVTPDRRGLRLSSLDSAHPPDAALVLLTNGLGGMARLNTDLGAVRSKYDCVLGANLHATLPVDRHVFAKRLRAWVSADGFISPLNAQNLVGFSAGPPAQWRFVANAGDGRSVEIQLDADLLELRNTTVLRFSRPPQPPPLGKDLPEHCDVRLTVRVDIEDRNFHTETHRNAGAEHHFSSHCAALADQIGFAFTPAADRHLKVMADSGTYHHEVEWSQGIAHPVEASRGQVDHGDAYSPGWFDLPLSKGAGVTLTVTADDEEPAAEETRDFIWRRLAANVLAVERANLPATDVFGRQLALATQAFVVRRGEEKTVIAGYPWFLDWGRDSLICARGLLAAGRRDEVLQLLKVFGRFEEHGTLPNTIHGENISNRDTSDAPLWFGVVCEELAASESFKLKAPGSKPQGATSTPPDLGLEARSLELGASARIYPAPVDANQRTIADVLRSIAVGYSRGTPNGIRVDAASGLVWSPAHFTWMDTNFPAGTPREGYPVEIQVLWIRLLRQLERIGAAAEEIPWGELARRAEDSLQKLFWLEDHGYFADVLLAENGKPAQQAVPDTALRSNYLLAVSLGLATGERARRCVVAALRHLVVPGALRSLAPLPVSPPLPVHAAAGRLLNNPERPYWGSYAGDEDTRRKPAYHNGTAWTWTFPTFCEALARAWNFSPPAVAAARAYLGSVDRLMTEGCLGHLPEILDGDAPHTQRGCDAQAWSVTEALRVWKLLNVEVPQKA